MFHVANTQMDETHDVDWLLLIETAGAVVNEFCLMFFITVPD